MTMHSENGGKRLEKMHTEERMPEIGKRHNFCKKLDINGHRVQ